MAGVERRMLDRRGGEVARASSIVRCVLGGLPKPADLGKVILVAAFGKAVIAKGPKAGAFIGAVAKACGSGGGGLKLAQARGRDGAALAGALEQAQLRTALG
jgi:alanyl-tRNA synthetase